LRRLTIGAKWLSSAKKKAAEACDFNGLFCYFGVEGGTSEGVAANSLKSIKFSYLRTKTLLNL
jgi:hypothetical protein